MQDRLESMLNLGNHEFYAELRTVLDEIHGDDDKTLEFYKLTRDRDNAVWNRLVEYRHSCSIDDNPYFEREKSSWRNVWGLFAGYVRIDAD